MTTPEGFTICLSSRTDNWWRYNVSLMCGCFDAADQRTGFASSASHIAEVGSNLATRPADIIAHRTIELTTPVCDHLILYLYIVPHSLPSDREVDATRPFPIEIGISYNGKLLRTEERMVNSWSGASIELKIHNS